MRVSNLRKENKIKIIGWKIMCSKITNHSLIKSNKDLYFEITPKEDRVSYQFCIKEDVMKLILSYLNQKDIFCSINLINKNFAILVNDPHCFTWVFKIKSPNIERPLMGQPYILRQNYESVMKSLVKRNHYQDFINTLCGKEQIRSNLRDEWLYYQLATGSGNTVALSMPKNLDLLIIAAEQGSYKATKAVYLAYKYCRFGLNNKDSALNRTMEEWKAKIEKVEPQFFNSPSPFYSLSNSFEFLRMTGTIRGTDL